MELIENFQRKYAEYRVEEIPAGIVPPVEIQNLRGRQTIAKLKALELQLALGERRPVTPNGLYRTSSRYRLVDEQGRLLASAESTLAKSDIGLGCGWVKVFSDVDTKSLFVAEEQSWATQRYIVITGAESSAGSIEKQMEWNVQYVWIPHRESRNGLSDPPKLQGIGNGKLYFLQDGRFYAIPFGALNKEASLEYGIG